MPSQSAREIANAIVGERWMDSFDKGIIYLTPEAVSGR